MGDVVELRAGSGTKPVPREVLEQVIRRIDEALANERPKPRLVYDGGVYSAKREGNGKQRKNFY